MVVTFSWLIIGDLRGGNMTCLGDTAVPVQLLGDIFKGSHFH